MQTCEVVHSEFEIHSGWQFGGFPVKSGKHEHTAFSFLTVHCEFIPHGVGVQISLSVKGSRARAIIS